MGQAHGRIIAQPPSGASQGRVQGQPYLTEFPNLILVSLDVEGTREAARVRAETRLRTKDAVQVAWARVARTDAIVTSDRRWVGRVSPPGLILLEDYVE